MDPKNKNKPEPLDPQKVLKSGDGKFSEDEKELLKQIAIHEAYSGAYKVKLAAVVLGKTAKVAGKALSLGYKGLTHSIKTIYHNQKSKRK